MRRSFRRNLTTPKKPRPAPKPFDVAARLEETIAALAAPAPEGITRVAPVGDIVHQWVLPLEVCPGINGQRHMHGWQMEKLKKACLGMMLAQQGGRRAPTPLPGRPMARCVRRSSNRPDRDQAFSKIPIDRLCVGRRRRPKNVPADVWAEMERQMGPADLGWLVDDKEKNLDLATWWEPAPPGKGCVLVELYTGAS